MGIHAIESTVEHVLRETYGITRSAGRAQIANPVITDGDIVGVSVTGDLTDNTTTFADETDPTKKVRIEAGGITPGQTRIITPPDANAAMASTDTAQTMSGVKTFADGSLKLAGSSSGAATLKAPAAAGTVVHTLPDATDTLVGRDTTDTMTNKTFVAPVLGAALATSINKVAITAPATGATLTIPDGAALTLPSGTRTLASIDGAETLTNKTLAAGTVMSDTVATGLQAKGAAGGAAGAVTSLTVLKTSVAENTATDAFTITVPNVTCGASIFVKGVGVLGDGDSAGAVWAMIAVSRIAGANAKTAVNDYAAGSQVTQTSGVTADVQVDILRGSVSGGVGATNTFTVQIRIHRSAGTSDNHTAVLEIVTLNGMAGGITVAAA